MNLKKWKVKDLIPLMAKYNPRIITDEAMSRLKHSLKKYGQVENLVLNTRTNVLISGHQRLRALNEMNIDIAWVHEIDVPESQEKALNVALNNPAMAGTWDMPKLQEVLNFVIEAPDIQLEDTGFDLDDYQELFPQDIEEEFEEIPIEEETDVRVGDVYDINGHILICGNCFQVDIPNKNDIDMVFLDPIYGLKEDLTPFIEMANTCDLMQSDKEIVKYAQHPKFHYLEVAKTTWSSFTTNKNPLNHHYTMAVFYDHNTFNPLNPIYSTFHERVNIPGRIEKSREFVSRVILAYTKEGDTILDPFAGRGTTMMVCEKLNRKSINIEINPLYVDNILKRAEKEGMNFRKV